MAKKITYFTVTGINGKPLSVKKAIALAKRTDNDLVYDAQGRYDESSWHWVYALLSNLKQYDEIKDFTVLKESSVKVESKEDTVY